MEPLTLLLLAMTSSADACSIHVRLSGASESRSVVLVRATGRTRAVPPPSEGYPDFGPGVEVTGWEFEVVRKAGSASLLSPGETLLGVPWGYAENCAPRIWTRDSWVPAGELAIFYASDEAERHVGGVPTLDVRGWHLPYPHAEVPPLRYLRPPEDRSEWLDAETVFELLSGLPVQLPDESAAEHLIRMERYFEEGPAVWSQRYPGSAILEEARRIVRQRRVG